MLDVAVIESLRAKFPDVHPLAFHRSVERAETLGELFDILSAIPDYPYVWDETQRRWRQETDITQSKKLATIQKGEK